MPIKQVDATELIMEFDCKLAHNDEIKKISGFSSINELYASIKQAFKVETSDILYCTINTHNFRNMNLVLGSHLTYGDLIVVHLCGSVRHLTMKKSHEFLGLTITDNSIGRSFVKRVKSDDERVEASIKPGDHIAAVNSESTIGMRHYEVAKAIRLLPQNVKFTISLIEPKYSNKYLNESDMEADRENSKRLMDVTRDRNSLTSSRMELLDRVAGVEASPDDLVNSSLPIERLLSKNHHHHQSSENSQIHPNDSYKSTIDKINTSLEAFLGISDNLLAIKIYRLARENKNSNKAFALAIEDSDLRGFDFDDDMKDYLWKCATHTQASPPSNPMSTELLN